MDNWQFALVVLGFGTGLAFFIDRMLARTRDRECDKPPQAEGEREKRKWLTFWFTGRFPSKEDVQAGEDECKDKGGEKPKKRS